MNFKEGFGLAQWRARTIFRWRTADRKTSKEIHTLYWYMDRKLTHTVVFLALIYNVYYACVAVSNFICIFWQNVSNWIWLTWLDTECNSILILRDEFVIFHLTCKCNDRISCWVILGIALIKFRVFIFCNCKWFDKTNRIYIKVL